MAHAENIKEQAEVQHAHRKYNPVGPAPESDEKRHQQKGVDGNGYDKESVPIDLDQVEHERDR